MSSEAERIEQLIDEIREDVSQADSLAEALADVTLHLRDRYKLWRSSVWSFEGTEAARLIATWAVGDTLFEQGMVVRFSLTSDTAYVASSVLAGRPMMMRVAERDLGLLTDLLRSEGVGSAVIVPLGLKRTEPVALLAFGSSASDVFRARDVRFAAALARALSEPMMPLIETALQSST